MFKSLIEFSGRIPKVFPFPIFCHLQSAKGLTYSLFKNKCVAGILAMPAYQCFFKDGLVS